MNLRNVYTTFPGGKHKVLTLSYDDGKIADRRLVALFNEYGLKGTFNVNSGLECKEFSKPYEERIPLSEYKELYKGHEVACHTVMHPTIARCPKEQMVLQVIEDRRKLEEALGVTVRGLAYPNGSFSDNVVDALKACGIRHARTVFSTLGFGMPEDYLRWNPTCSHKSESLLKLSEDFLNLHKTQYLYMMYVWGHSYEFEIDNNWNVIEDFAKKMGGKDDIWYATNIEIVDYLDAADRLQVSVNADFAYNPSAMSVWIEVDKKHIECKPGVITSF
ncbi:polysaccharide deacetylase family protein [Butyrivibrio sp. YAB3001]|uniref:polysaccharide deacetylase family protein n=1 Tax=Butyrivibrio sp. YAB3001 TaxID=1520812 RepID=UPI0008F67629|nr:polysaccharide deacetylase family protein [Butyrivibrio sp. YAB3001]SFB75383.1 Polysaccharide deacetylase [Butyrivibrio sp. YAB3001]